MSIKHSKYKNTGILFELLTRQITSDILSGKQGPRAIPILEKYFNRNEELGKELVLYLSFFNGKKLSETKSLDYINIVVDQRKKLDNRKLKLEKYNLVKEIKENYDYINFFLIEFLLIKSMLQFIRVLNVLFKDIHMKMSANSVQLNIH